MTNAAARNHIALLVEESPAPANDINELVVEVLAVGIRTTTPLATSSSAASQSASTTSSPGQRTMTTTCLYRPSKENPS
jgi:hypothetical protein